VPMPDTPELTVSGTLDLEVWRRGVARLPVLENLPSITGRCVRVRVCGDLTVALRPAKGGRYEVDDFRLRSSVPPAERLLTRRAEMVVRGHLGQSKGKIDPRSAMAPVREAALRVRAMNWSPEFDQQGSGR
jgi:3-phosphoglycerate kinase